MVLGSKGSLLHLIDLLVGWLKNNKNNKRYSYQMVGWKMVPEKSSRPLPKKDWEFQSHPKRMDRGNLLGNTWSLGVLKWGMAKRSCHESQHVLYIIFVFCLWDIGDFTQFTYHFQLDILITKNPGWFWGVLLVTPTTVVLHNCALKGAMKLEPVRGSERGTNSYIYFISSATSFMMSFLTHPKFNIDT